MNDCIFCKIANKEIASKTIYEDDIVKVFLDVNPETNGHSLVIPKKHFKDIDDIDENTLAHIFKISKKIKEKLSNKLSCDGISFIQNNGDCQEIKHFHLHIRPYYKKQEKTNVDDIFKILTDNDN